MTGVMPPMEVQPSGETCPNCGIDKLGIGHDLSVKPFGCSNPPRKLHTVSECLASIVMGRLNIPSEHKLSTPIEDRMYIEQLLLRELHAAYNDGRKAK